MKKFALCLFALTVASASTLVYANPPSPVDQKSMKEAVNVFQQAKQTVNRSPALLKQVGTSAVWLKNFAQTQPALVNAAVKKALSQGSLTPKQKLDLEQLARAKGGYSQAVTHMADQLHQATTSVPSSGIQPSGVWDAFGKVVGVLVPIVVAAIAAA